MALFKLIQLFIIRKSKEKDEAGYTSTEFLRESLLFIAAVETCLI